MQKNQPTARFPIDESYISGSDASNSYARGYAEGFEAGRASLGDGTANRRSLSQGNRDSNGAQQARIKTFGNQTQQRSGQKNSPITGRLSGGFQPRKSLDKPIKTRDVQTRKSFDQPITNRDFHTQKLYDQSITTRDFQARKSFDQPITTRDFQTRKSFDQPITNRDFHTQKPYDQSIATRDFQTRKSFDQPTTTRDVHIHNQDHEMEGQTTNPETEVKFNTRGHY
jgi:hypothetical protein